MKKLVLVSAHLVVCLSLFSFNTLANGDATQGKEKAAVCAACHGVDGNSAIPLYPKLSGQHQSYLIKQLTDFRLATQKNNAEGRVDPSMAGIVAGLSDNDISDLAAYFSQQPAPAPIATTSDTIDVAKQLYNAGDAKRGITACVACHGPKGEGISLAKFPRISGQQPEYIQKQLEAFRSGSRANDLNSMMQITMKHMTDDEIVKLSKYVSALQ